MTQHTSRSTDRRRRYSRALRQLEALEPRTLLSVVATPYTLTGAYAGLGAYDNQGTLWIYDNYSHSLEPVINGAVDRDAAIGLDSDPQALASAPNGHIYAADMGSGDYLGAIFDIDLVSNSVTAIDMESSAKFPTALTVTGDGAVWFLGHDSNSDPVVGRVDPQNSSLSTCLLPATSSIGLIVSSGNDSVWIGMGAKTPGVSGSINCIVAASVDGTSISTTTYPVNTGNSIADTYNIVNGLAAGADGSVWFTLSNNPSIEREPSQLAPDQIIYGKFAGDDLVQTAYIAPDASATNALNLGDLALDANGDVWFFEFEGNKFGMLDTSTGVFATPLAENLSSDHFHQSVANADGTQISLLNVPNTGNSSVIQINLLEGIAVNGPATQQGSAINDWTLATFHAPSPASGTYDANITWGDGTTSSIPATLTTTANDSYYAIVVSDKTFENPGTYTGTVEITAGTTIVATTLNFTSTITPANTNPFSGQAYDLQAQEGDVINKTVATFTAPAPASGAYTATVTWGDGTTSEIAATPATEGTNSFYAVVVSEKIFDNAGAYDGQINITDGTTAVGTTLNFTSTITAVPFSGGASDVGGKEDTALNIIPLATFTATTPASGYTATITWGDGTTSTVAATEMGYHTYAIIVSGKSFATQGIYAGSIAVKDGTNAVGTLTFTSTISDTPLNVTSVTASPLFLRIVTAVGTFTDDGDLALSTWKATINWGDNTTSTGIIVRDPTQAGRYLVLALHQYRARGTYTVRLTVTTSEANVDYNSSTLTTTVTAR